MRIFLDSAKKDEIRRVKTNDLVEGVTTNPKLVRLAFEEENFSSLENYFRDLLKISKGEFFIQVENNEPQRIIEQTRRFASLNKERIVVKLPCNDNGMKSLSKLQGENIKTCVTALFTPGQALEASVRGTDYVAFYYDRFVRSGGNAKERLEKIVRILERTENETHVVVGSLKDGEQVSSSVIAGADIVTLPLNLIESLNNHKLSRRAFDKFSEDWTKINSNMD